MITEIWIAMKILNGLIDAIEAFKDPETDFDEKQLLHEIKTHVPDEFLPELAKLAEERVGNVV